MRFPFSVGQGNAESSKRRERKDVPWSSDVCSSDLMRSKVSNVVLSEPGTGWPVLRMNAVPLLSWPRECRKFEAKIGGAKEVRELLQRTAAQLVAVRSQHGVLSFGGDAEVRRVFADHQPEKLD